VTTITSIICVEATRDLSTTLVQGDGPLAHFEGEEIKERIGLVPILRAGLGMVDGKSTRRGFKKGEAQAQHVLTILT
jgi:uracil phosphoribosyltransferase